MAIVNLKIKSLLKKRRGNKQKQSRQTTTTQAQPHRKSRRVAKPVDTTPTWVDTPNLTILPEGEYMSEPAAAPASVARPTTVSISRPGVKYTTPVRQLEAPDEVDYDEARRRLGDVYLAATQGFGSDFIRPPRYPKRK